MIRGRIVRLVARSMMVVLIACGGPATAFAGRVAATSVTTPVSPAGHRTAAAMSSTGSPATSPGRGQNSRSLAPNLSAETNASASAANMHFVAPRGAIGQPTLLQSLLATPRGRALLRHTYGPVILAALERTYGPHSRAATPGLAPHRNHNLHPDAGSVGAVGAVGAAADTGARGLWTRMIRAGIVADDTPVTPTVTLSLASAPAGTTVGLSGANFGPNETVDALLDGVHLTAAYLTTDGTGTIVNSSGSRSITIPSGTAPGAHTLTFFGQTSGRRVTVGFRVYALGVAPSEGAPGATVAITGAGFAPAQVVTLTLGLNSGGPEPLGIGGTDNNGTLTPLSVTVPTTAADGLRGITAQDDAGESVTAPFAVVAPGLSLSPSAAQIGDSVAVRADGFISLAGFFSTDEIYVYIDQGQTNQYVFGDSNGNVNGSLTVPSTVASNSGTSPLNPGLHTVTLVGLYSGHVVSGTLRVFGITAAPGSGPAGAPIRVTGGGFTPNEAVTATLGAATAMGTVDSNGNVPSLALTVPAGTPLGATPITLTGSGGEQATTTFAVVSAGLTLSPTVAAPGTRIVVKGDGYIPAAGYNPGETIYLYDDGAYLGTATADYNGQFVTGFGGLLNTAITVPSGYAPGAHTITAVGAASGHSLSATFREAAVRVAPAGGTGGVTVSVQGGGFAATSPLTVNFNGGQLTSNTTTDGGGAFSLPLSIPAAQPAGVYPLTATDGMGASAVATYTLSTAAITLTPSFGTVGQQYLNVDIGGFGGDTYVDVYFGDCAGGRLVTSLYLPNGAHSQYAVPDLGLTGPVTVTAYGHPDYNYGSGCDARTDRVAQTVFTIVPGLQLARTTGAPGATVGVTATGFQPGENVDLLLDGSTPVVEYLSNTGYVVGHGTADGSGQLSATGASFVVPALIHGVAVAPGLHTIYAYGRNSQSVAQTTFTIQLSTLDVRYVIPVASLTGANGGQAGDQISVVNAGGLPTSDRQVLLYWDGDNQTGQYLGSANQTLRVPAGAAPGLHLVAAYGLPSHTLVEGTFEVVSLIASPARGMPGSAVTVTARGYQPGEGVDLAFADSEAGTPFLTRYVATVGNAVADSSGVAIFTVTVPMTVQGQTVPAKTNIFTAHGRASGYLATARYQVIPSTLLVSPPGGASGDYVSVSAPAGWSPDDTYAFYWDGGRAHGLYLGTGGIPFAFRAPAATPGPHVIDAYGSVSGVVIHGVYQVVTLGLTPTSAPIGAGGTALVSGFAPGETVTLLWDGTSGSSLVVGSAAVTATGSAAIPFTVPGNANGPVHPGPHTVYAVGRQSGAIVGATFGVQPAALLFTPAGAGSGATVTVAGDGMAPMELVHLYFNGDNRRGLYLGEALADYAGHFSASVTIPNGYRPGQHLIAAYGEQSMTLEEGAFDLLNAGLAVAPGALPPGGTETVTATGFTAGEGVDVYLDGDNILGTPVAAATAGADGSTGAVTFSVPLTATPGTHTLAAYGNTKGELAGATFIVAGVAAVPARGQAGDSTDLVGGGYRPYESLTVLFDGARAGIRTGFGGNQAAPDGTFDGSVTIPATAVPGPHTLLVIGDKGTRYSTTFAVLALAVSPAVAVPNGDVRVSGAGFTPGETVYLSLDGPSSPLFLASRTAGPTGALSPTLVMIPDGTPAATYGLYAVGADSGFVLHTPLQVAAATLTLQPPFGQTGDTLQLSADGFSNGEPVVVYLDDVYQSTIYTGGYNQILTTCPSGHGTCLVAPFTIPASTAPGPHTVQLIGFTTGHVVSGALRVYAATASPAQGVAGSVVRLGGSGFAPGEALTVTLGLGNGASAAPTTADANGMVMTVTLTVPSGAPLGPLPISIDGAGGEHATGAFAVVSAALTASPNAAPAGDTITLSGDGYLPGEQVLLFFDGSPQGTGYYGLNPGADGRFSTLVKVSSTASLGAHRWSAVGYRSGRRLTTPFSVVALSASPAVTHPGAAIHVSGGGFAPGETVAFYFDGDPSNGQPLGATTAPGGSFGNVALTVPITAASGQYLLYVFGGTSHALASVALNVQGPLDVSPSSGPPTTTVTLHGSGFTSSENVQILLDGALISTAYVDGGGALRAAVGLPARTAFGTHTLTVLGPSNGASAAGLFRLYGIALAPAGGAAGSGTRVTGGGFSPNQNVALTAGGLGMGSTTTDAGGTLTPVSITIPATATTGVITVTASDGAGEVVSTPFAVNSDGGVVAVNPAAGWAPGRKYQGTSGTFSVSGFQPGEYVDLSYDVDPSGDTATGVSEGAFQTTSSGTASGPFTPVARATTAYGMGSGPRRVVVVGRGSGIRAETTFNLIVPTVSLGVRVLTPGGSTTVSGAGFASHESVAIYLDDPNTPADELTAATADANGNVPATSITIPAATATGAHTIYLEGFTSHGEGSAIVQVVVAGSLTFSPAGAPVGSQIFPAGAGLLPGEAFAVYIDGDAASGLGPVATGTANGSGAVAFYPYGVTIPAGLAIGTHTLDIVGLRSGTVLSGPFGVVDLSVGRPSAAPGSAVSIHADGFKPSEPVTATIGASPGAGTTVLTTTVSGSGVLDGAFTVPAITSGGYDLSLTGAGGYQATLRFAVAGPGLTFTPPGAQSGDTFVASATGDFASGEPVLFYWDGDGSNGLYLGTATAQGGGYSGDGSVSNVSLQVPSGAAAGDHTITAIGALSGLTATGVLHVAAIRLTPAYGQGGTEVGIDGGGFGPGEYVDVSFQGANTSSVAVVRAQALGNGAISRLNGFTYTTPISIAGVPLAPGNYTVTAVGESTNTKASAAFHYLGVSYSPAGIPAGGALAVHLAGFTPNEHVRLYFDGDQNTGAFLSDLATDSTGAYPSFGQSFGGGQNVPAAAAPGPHLLTAVGVRSHSVVTTTLQVIAAALDRPSYAVGATAGVTATDFTPNEPLQLYLNQDFSKGDTTNGDLVGTGTAGPDGNTSSSALIFTVPATITYSSFNRNPLTPGLYYLTIYGTRGQEAVTLPFVVGVPGLTVQPTSAQAMQYVTVRGSGFALGETILLFMGPDLAHAAYMGLDFENEGRLYVGAPVPSGLEPGPQTIFAQGLNSGITQTVPFTLTGITLHPDETYAGGTITVDGGSFAPTERVNLYLDDTTTSPVGATTAGLDGSFRGLTLTLPTTLTVGGHTVYAVGATSAFQAFAALRIDPPASTATPTGIATSTSTNTPAATPTNTTTPAATPSPTITNTPAPTNTLFPTATRPPTRTPTGTGTATNTSTNTPTGTATATNTSAAAPTATATPTNTATPSPTNTAANTPTTGPTATPSPTANANACLQERLGGWYFESTSCSSNRATNVRVAPPAGLALAAPIGPLDLPGTLVGNSFRLSTPVALPDLGIGLAGYTLAATGASVDSNGLTVQTATLALPAALSGATLTAHTLVFGTDGSLSGAPSLSPDTLHIALGSLGLDASSVTLSGNGVSAGTLTVTLPPNAAPNGGPNTLVGHNITLKPDGSFGGNTTLPDATLAVAGFTINAHTIALTNGGLTIASATFALPASLSGGSPITLIGTGLLLGTDGTLGNSLTVSGQGITLAGFAAQTTNIILDRTGLSIDRLTLTPPAVFNLAPLTANGVYLGMDGSISGTISIPGALSFAIGGFTFSGSTVTLSRAGIGVGTLNVTLPAALGGTTLSGHNIFLNSDGTFSGAPGATPAPASAANRGREVTAFSPLPRPGEGSGVRVAARTPAMLGDTAVTLAGVPVLIRGITLSTSGLGVQSATATLPSSLTPAGGNPITLTGSNLALNTDGGFTGRLTVSGQNLTLAGFNARTTDITLDQTGLGIDDLTLTPPAAFHLAPIDVLGIALHADGSISGTVAITGPLSFSIGAFAFSIATITLSQAGIGAGTLSLTLPAALGGTTLSGHNIFLNSDGSFSGAPGPATAVAWQQTDTAVSGQGPATAGAWQTTGRPRPVGAARAGTTRPLDPFETAGILAGLRLPSTMSSNGQPLGAGMPLGTNGILAGLRSLSTMFGTADSSPAASAGWKLAVPEGTTTVHHVPHPTAVGPWFAMRPQSQASAPGTSRPPAMLGDANVTLAGVPVAIHGLTLSTGGIGAQSATATLPSSLTPPGGGAITLIGNGLSLNTDGSFTGSLTVSGAAIAVAGYTAQASPITLDGGGLRAGALSLTLPAAFGGATLSGSNVSIGANGTFAGTLTFSPGTVTFTLGGFAVAASGLSLGSNGVAVDTLSVSLPSGGALAARGITLRADGSFGGSVALPDTTFTLAGFSVAGQGVALSTNGLTIASATASLPAALSGGSSVALTGSGLTLGTDGSLRGALTAPGQQFTLDGFAARTGAITLDGGGLKLASLTVTLPAAFGGNTLTASNVAVGADGSLAGTLVLSPGTLDFSYQGFALHLDGLSLGSGGVSVGLLALTLPGGIVPSGASNTISAHNVTLRPNGSIGGTLDFPAVGLAYAGFTVNASGIGFGRNSLSIAHASFTLPAALLPGGAAPVTLSGSLTVAANGSLSGSLTVPNVSLTLAGFSVRARSVTLDGNGVNASGVSLALPAALSPGGGPPITLGGNLRVTPNLQIQGTLTVSPVSLSYNGFTIGADDIQLGSFGMVVENVRYTLPATLGGSTLVGTLHVSPSFALSGKLEIDNIRFDYDLFHASADSVSLDSSGIIQITNAQVSLPGLADTSLGGNLTASLSGGGLRVSGQLTAHNVNLKYAGFVAQAQAMTLDNSGVAVDGASLTVPALGGSDGASAPFVLRGALHIDAVNGSYTVSGHLDLASASLLFFGFRIDATGLSLGNTGLTVGASTLHLPPLDGLSQSTITILDLRVTPDFHVAGGRIQAGTNLDFGLFGARISAQGINLSADGLSAASITVALPDALGGAGEGSFTLTDLDIRGDGNVKATVPPSAGLKFALADFSISAPGGATFSTTDGFKVPNLTLSLPILQGTFALTDLRYDGHALTIGGGKVTIHVDLPPINAGGFNISASADLTLSLDHGHVGFDLVGIGDVTLASVGKLHALLEVGTVDDNHPSNLYRAKLDVQIFGSGIPIPPPSPSSFPVLYINGISGEVDITGTRGHAIYTFGIGVDLETVDGGFIFHGNGHGTFSSDGNFGFGATGTIFEFFTIAGGFCVRFVAVHDYVCQNSLTNHGAGVDTNSNSTGLYAEVSGGYSICLDNCASITADAYAHVWIDSDGPEIAASARIAASVDKSFIAWEIAPCGFSAGADVELGRFRDLTAGGTARGIKGRIAATVDCGKLIPNFHFHKDIFIDDHAGVHIFSVDDYQLIDDSSGAAYLVTRLPDGGTMARRVRALAGPLHARQVTVPLRVMPGQTDTTVTLLWHGGAPSLTLTAPDGTTYTPRTPGAGNYALADADPRGLPPGFTAGRGLYLPRPRAGLWHVTVGNLRGGEGYHLAVDRTTPDPVLRVTVPARAQTLAANPLAVLQGTLRGPNTGANPTVSLYYTTAPTTVIRGHTMPNYAGQSIAAGVPVRHGGWSYRWDTSALPAGVYYIYAMLDNGTGPAVNGYSAGTVRVVQPVRPDAPRDVMAIQQSGRLTVTWSSPRRAGIVAGYRLHWRTSAMPAGRSYTLDLGNLQSDSINETEPGARYAVSISDYDLSGHESAAVPARLTVLRPGQNVGAGAADFRLAAGRGAMAAGGFIQIPLTLTPLGRPLHGPADTVTLSVQGLPDGVAARPNLSNVDLFDLPSGLARPALVVLTRATVRPGVYPIMVTVRQSGSGRARRARAILVVRRGEADFISLSAGPVRTRRDRLRGVAVTARVVDRSGAPVADGTIVHFSLPEGFAQPGVARTRSGLAHATVVYLPGAHPVVTADATVVLGHLLLGRAPRGAGTRRLFAAAATRPTSAGAPLAGEDLVLRNPLGAQAQVRVHLHLASPTATGASAGTRTTEQVIALALNPNGAYTLHLDVVAGTVPLIGVEVRSDLPIIATRVLRYTVTTRRGHGRHARTVVRTVVVGSTAGVDAPRQVYRFRFAVGRAGQAGRAGRRVLDLYNPAASPMVVRVTVSGAGLRRPTATRLTLAPYGSTRLDVTPQAPTPRGGRAAGRLLTVTVRAAAPVVVETEP